MEKDTLELINVIKEFGSTGILAFFLYFVLNRLVKVIDLLIVQVTKIGEIIGKCQK